MKQKKKHQAIAVKIRREHRIKAAQTGRAMRP